MLATFEAGAVQGQWTEPVKAVTYGDSMVLRSQALILKHLDSIGVAGPSSLELAIEDRDEGLTSVEGFCFQSSKNESCHKSWAEQDPMPFFILVYIYIYILYIHILYIYILMNSPLQSTFQNIGH